MRAIDTNIIARLLLRDDPRQLDAVAPIIEDGVRLPLTVLVELAWLLRSRLKLGQAGMAAAFAIIADADSIDVEGGEHLPWLIDRIAAGAGPADMIHLIASRHAVGFVTFDRDLARHADGAPVPVTLAG